MEKRKKKKNVENVDPRIWFWFSTKKIKKKNIEFSDSGFPPTNTKKKNLKKKKKTWKTWIRESGFGFPQKKKKKNRILRFWFSIKK